MGLDCRIYVVPKHESNPSVFLEDFEVPNAHDTGTEYVSFHKEVAYWRKNWFIFYFFASKGKVEDFNGHFLLITEKDVDELIEALNKTSTEDYNFVNNNEFNHISFDVAELEGIKELMEKYDGVLQFYFEGDY